MVLPAGSAPHLLRRRADQGLVEPNEGFGLSSARGLAASVRGREFCRLPLPRSRSPARTFELLVTVYTGRDAVERLGRSRRLEV